MRQKWYITWSVFNDQYCPEKGVQKGRKEKKLRCPVRSSLSPQGFPLFVYIFIYVSVLSACGD